MGNNIEDKKVGIGAYIALIFAIVFFSGIFGGFDSWIKIFDFTTLSGSFGHIAEKFSFRGAGGNGARDGFLFSMYLTPSVILALAVVAVVEHYGALEAARKLLTPLLRPLLGIPGVAGLAMITSLQSTDGGAAMTLALSQENEVTNKEKTIFASWQFSAGATITNYFASSAALYALTLPGGGLAVKVPLIVPFTLILILKFFGANVVRIYLKAKGSN